MRNSAAVSEQQQACVRNWQSQLEQKATPLHVSTPIHMLQQSAQLHSLIYKVTWERLTGGVSRSAAATASPGKV